MQLGTMCAMVPASVGTIFSTKPQLRIQLTVIHC